MPLTDRLSLLVALRTQAKVAAQTIDQLKIQNALLSRLVDHLCGPVIEKVPVSVKERSLDYTSDGDQARILEFSAKVRGQTGHEPTEEEIVQFLDGVPVGIDT